MAEKNTASIGFEKQILDAACVLWGHIPAAEYRKVIVGLIFLRYISSAFEKRYNELVAEGDGFEDEPDAYLMDNIFFVPEKARWSVVSAAAHTPEIGSVIDDAMRAIEDENKTLKNVLPKNYASPDLDKRVLGDVVDLFTNMDMTDTEDSKDLLGRTYEYCIAQFAAYEGVKGGEFYTPSTWCVPLLRYCVRLRIAVFMILVAVQAVCLCRVRNSFRLTAETGAISLFTDRSPMPTLGKWLR